jgi:hypothetical protein
VIIPFSIGDVLQVIGTILLMALVMRTGSTKRSAASHEPHIAAVSGQPRLRRPAGKLGHRFLTFTPKRMARGSARNRR